MPYGTNWYRNVSCETASELGVSHAWLPVVHTYDLHQKWRLPGVWLYYARGCSDLLWNVGRTLLALNKVHAAVLLLQRQAKAQRRGGRPTTGHAQLARHQQRHGHHLSPGLMQCFCSNGSGT